ncbi:hypothetical protein B0J11DRAFT_522297 [Dendryphion nanum]|uniref:Uncharacterized protein n=1 Tax=Dendryphion nanum TaxID=256645 RepID=A0A9P9E3G7_9PLEO|nr:hypothetical protein B0J11DRAFT_522297 [Dendryphion nanum]
MSIDFSAYFARAKAEHSEIFSEPETSTLEAYLTQSITSQQCATEITKYTNRRVPVNGKIGAVYNSILHTGRDVPESQDDLIELVKEIRTVSASKDTGNIDWSNEVQLFNESVRGIRDALWSETLAADQTNARTTGPTDTSRQWTNFNALLAKLYAEDLCDDLLNALDLISKTLEVEKRSASQLEMNLGAVAAWLEHASREIKNNAGKIPAGFNWAKESTLVKGTQVDQNRLAFWRERLEKLSTTEGLSDETVEACERATYAIERALWEKKK